MGTAVKEVVMAVIIVGGDKGGVGKNLISEGCFLAAVQRGLKPRMFEIETERRMAQKFPDSVFVPTGAPTPQELYAHPDSIFEPLDRGAAQMAQEELAIVCAGASVTQAFLKWSAGDVGRAFFAQGEGLHFVCVLTMQDQALRSGLGNLAAFADAYPQAKRTAVLNPVVAPFVEGDRNIERALLAATRNGRPIGVVRVERMSAPAWGYMSNMGRLDEIANKTWKDLVALGLPEAPSIRSMGLYDAWLSHLLASLAYVLPKQELANRKVKKD
jgi:hypothetical protein